MDEARLPSDVVTRKEAEVLDALAERLTNAEIADRLCVSHRTVESHVSSLLRKFDFANRRELAELARSRRRDSSRARRVPSAFDLAVESGPLVGRRCELDELRALWRRASSGRTIVAVVTGEAGIGKSRLVAEFATEVHGEGGRVLLGSCFEDVQNPYEPFADAISGGFEGMSPDDVRGEFARDVRALGHLFPSFLAETGTTDVVDAATERAEVLAGIARHLVRAAQAGAVLLVLEDLHWASPTTRDVLRHLVRTARRVPLLSLVTSRDTPPEATDDLTAVLNDLARAPGAHHLRIGGLDRPNVEELIASISDPSSGVDAHRIYLQTGGNPLFVREMVAAGPGGPALGSSVHSLLALRSRHLSTQDNALLDLAAVLGAEFDAELLARITGRSLTQVLRALDRAEAAGLTTRKPAHPARFAFVHALFRSARYEALPYSRRLKFHERVAHTLAERTDDDRVIPDLARHAFAALPLGDASLAIEACRRAGDLVNRSLGFEEAARYYRSALDVASDIEPRDDIVCCELRIRLGEALTSAGDAEGRAVLEQAATSARQLEASQLLATVAWALSQFGLGFLGLFDPFVTSVAEEAFAGIGQEPTATRARLLLVLAAEYAASLEHHQRRQALWAEALAIARQLDDPVTLGQVLAAYQWSCWDPDNLEERIAASEELADLGDRLDQPVFRILAHSSQSWNLLERGDVAAGFSAARTVETLAGDRPMAAAALRIASRRATRLFMAGELDAAEEAAKDLVTLGQSLPPDPGFDPIRNYAPHLMVIRFNQGRIGELLPLIERVAATVTPVVAFRAALALAQARTGNVDAARDLLFQLTDPTGEAMPRNFQWFTGMICLADAAEVTGADATAARLAEQLDPYSGRLAHHGTGVSHPIDIALAQLALACGENERAQMTAAAAISAARRTGTPIFLARGLVLRAAALQRLGHHPSKLKPLIDQSLVIAQRTGARLLEQEIARYQLA